MFWTDHGRTPAVERSAMDGTNRRALVRGTNIRGPVGITIDYVEEKVYWLDDILRVLWKMDLDGGESFVVVVVGSRPIWDRLR